MLLLLLLLLLLVLLCYTLLMLLLLPLLPRYVRTAIMHIVVDLMEAWAPVHTLYSTMFRL